jgi:UV excision repair protein RAD23
MKVQVKSISGEIFTAECEESDSVLKLKQSIQTVKGWDTSLIRLVHAGKILENDQTISSAGIKETSFVVCMVSKPKPEAKPVAAPAPATPVPATPAPSAAPSVVAAAPTPAPAAVPATPVGQETNPFAGAGFESAVDNIRGMGFPEPDIRLALRAAYGNPDRAVDLLMAGVPTAALQVQAQRASMAAGGSPAAAARPAAAAANPNDPFSALRAHPQFNALRRQIQADPSSLTQVLAQLSATSPELLQTINANSDQFLAMMNEPLEEDEDAGMDEDMVGDENDLGPVPPAVAQMAMLLANMPAEQRAEMAQRSGIPAEQVQQLVSLGMLLQQNGGDLSALGGGAGGGNQNVVRLTPEEAAAVDRLVGMGFPRNLVIEAYIACDKNEELAANYLLENMLEDDDS